MNSPLAEELRPNSLDGFFGQTEILGEKDLLPSLLKRKKPLSILLFGPPGCGKTTLAKIYIKAFEAKTFFFHPATHGVSDLKKWIGEIESSPLFYGTCILFIDEIHRLNKGQQDALLPFIEKGTFTLIAATTENPSFSLNNALLSRLRVIPLKSLDKTALDCILTRALEKKPNLSLSDEGKSYLIEQSGGDARHLLNCVENLFVYHTEGSLTVEEISSLSFLKRPLYDKDGEEHYNLVSALHKSIRGSDPDAALYWITRMLAGGEDPGYIARRLTRIAIEDIGLADPQAMNITLNAWQVFERLGSPEGDLALAEAAIFLALSPKSVACYKAFKKAHETVKNTSHLPPPKTILNAHTSFMQSMGYGKGYLYDPDTPGGFSGQNYFPDDLEQETFYEPTEVGFERDLKKRNDFFKKKRS